MQRTGAGACVTHKICLSPADVAAAQRAGLIDSEGYLTGNGRVLVGENRGKEPLSSFTRRWLQLRGPMNLNPRPPGFKEE